MAELDKVVVRAVDRRGPVAILSLQIQGFSEGMHNETVRRFGWVRQDDSMWKSESALFLVDPTTCVSHGRLTGGEHGLDPKFVRHAKLCDVDWLVYEQIILIQSKQKPI